MHRVAHIKGKTIVTKLLTVRKYSLLAPHPRLNKSILTSIVRSKLQLPTLAGISLIWLDRSCKKPESFPTVRCDAKAQFPISACTHNKYAQRRQLSNLLRYRRQLVSGELVVPQLAAHVSIPLPLIHAHAHTEALKRRQLSNLRRNRCQTIAGRLSKHNQHANHVSTLNFRYDIHKGECHTHTHTRARTRTHTHAHAHTHAHTHTQTYKKFRQYSQLSNLVGHRRKPVIVKLSQITSAYYHCYARADSPKASLAQPAVQTHSAAMSSGYY